jgi:tetratricopeptide (TPR) repeat protein
MTEARNGAPKSLLPRALVAWGVVVLVCGVALGDAAAKKKDDEEKKKNQYTVSEKMHKKLTGAQEQMEADQYDAARELLAPLEERADRLNPYERALTFLFLGFLDASQDRYEEALRYFELCLVQDSLPTGQQLSTRFNVAQLYLATENYAESERTLEVWFEEAESPTGVAFYLLAISRYQLEKYEAATVPAREAVASTRKPKEPWLQLLVGLYLELERYEEALPPLEQLVTLYPKRVYWTQLSALYAQLDKEEKALAVLQLAYEQGFLEDDRELRQLARLYLSHGLPYRAALLLEKALEEGTVAPDVDSLETLASSWIVAREYDKAIEPLRLAAELDEGGDLYVRLGQVYLERDSWKEATAALDVAFEKGTLKDPGKANLLLGIALYHQDRYRLARKHFAAALAEDSSSTSAKSWLDLLKREPQSG